MEELVYVSSAVQGLTDADLEALLAKARERNQRLGITGVLLYDEGDFFQYLEGSAEALDEAYAHIVQSPQHRSILLLVRGPIAARNFGSWSMGFVKVPKSELLQLAHAQWRSALAAAVAAPAAPAASTTRSASAQPDLPSVAQGALGLELLLLFWRQHRAQRWG